MRASNWCLNRAHSQGMTKLLGSLLPLFGVPRPVTAFASGGLTPLVEANAVCKGCDRSQPTKAVTGHRTPKRSPFHNQPHIAQALTLTPFQAGRYHLRFRRWQELR